MSEILKESTRFNRIGSFWDRKGHNEIDIVAINDLDKEVVFFDAKLRGKNFDAAKLEQEVNYAINKLKLFDYNIRQQCVALDDFDAFIKEYGPN